MAVGEASTDPHLFRKKTFAEILSSAALGKSFSVDVPSPPSDGKLQIGLHKGRPSVKISKQRLMAYSAPYKWAIVGKFSQGRPMLEDIHSFLVSHDLKGEFHIGILDARHIVINFLLEADFLRFFSKPFWHIGESVMRTFKWTVNFHVDKESSTVPIWVELEKLPIFLFNKEALFAIASTIGSPLRLDNATVAISKPSVARFQVEIDLLKERPDMIWIDIEEGEGFWQKIKYTNVPSYCCHCWHLGHDLSNCHVKDPSLKSSKIEATQPEKMKQNSQNFQPKKIYRIKEGPFETLCTDSQKSDKIPLIEDVQPDVPFVSLTNPAIAQLEQGNPVLEKERLQIQSIPCPKLSCVDLLPANSSGGFDNSVIQNLKIVGAVSVTSGSKVPSAEETVHPLWENDDKDSSNLVKDSHQLPVTCILQDESSMELISEIHNQVIPFSIEAVQSDKNHEKFCNSQKTFKGVSPSKLSLADEGTISNSLENQSPSLGTDEVQLIDMGSAMEKLASGVKETKLVSTSHCVENQFIEQKENDKNAKVAFNSSLVVDLTKYKVGLVQDVVDEAVAEIVICNDFLDPSIPTSATVLPSLNPEAKAQFNITLQSLKESQKILDSRLQKLFKGNSNHVEAQEGSKLDEVGFSPRKEDQSEKEGFNLVVPEKNRRRKNYSATTKNVRTRSDSKKEVSVF